MLKKFFGKKGTPKDPRNEFEQIVEIIKEMNPGLAEYNIQGPTTFEDLGFDSIKYINLMLSLEDIVEKDIEVIVNHLDFGAIKRVDDLVSFVIEMKE